MRIATYNIHRTIGGDGRPDAARIGAVLRELDADLVALQEVGSADRPPNPVLTYLGDILKAHRIEGVTLIDERGRYGNAVLTRLATVDIRRHDISVTGRERRGAIEMHLDIGGSDIQLIATHLGLGAGERRHQIGKLLSLLTASKAEVKILLGDFNEWFPWRPSLWRLQRLFPSVPPPATFPARRPYLPLDRIWVRPRAALLRVYAHDSPLSRLASDHRPLVAELDDHVVS